MLGAIIALLVSVAILTLNKSHIKVENRSSRPVSAAELSTAYQNNDSLANTRYLNKALEVSGSVSGIDRNMDGGSMILLESGTPDMPVQCSMRDAIEPLPTGAQVRLKGFCTGSNLGGVTLTDCIVAAN